MDQAWWDAQYNNRARVPNAAEVLARWEAASVLARAEQACQLDLAYGEDPAERLDVFGPLSGPAPILIFIHGGYWRALDKADHSFLARALVASGAMVVVPNYSLCPQAVDELTVSVLPGRKALARKPNAAPRMKSAITTTAPGA